MTTIFIRNSNDGRSIEKIFYLLFKNDSNVNIHKMNFISDGFINRILLCFEAFFKSSAINHVSGDILFITPFVRNKSIVTFHDFIRYKELKGIRKIMYKYIMIIIPHFFANKVTVISKYTLNELEIILGRKSKKTKIIYNPLTISFNTNIIKNENINVNKALFIGTKKNKNLPGAIKALRKTNIKLTVIGKIPTYEMSLIRKFNISYKEVYDLDENELINCYLENDFLLFPSFEEGFGLPIIESQSLGKPVITSKIGCMPEIGGKDAALYVDPYDISSINEAINELKMNNNKYKALIKAGLNNSKKYNISITRDNYKKLYNSLLS